MISDPLGNRFRTTILGKDISDIEYIRPTHEKGIFGGSGEIRLPVLV